MKTLLVGSNIKNLFVFTGSVLGFLASILLGGWTELMNTLIILQAIDFFTGIIAQTKLGNGDSRLLFKGIIKKSLYWLVLVMCYRIDLIISPDTLSLLNMGLGAFILGDVYSIIENVGKLGIGTEFLTKYLTQVKIYKENEDNEDISSK